MAYLSQLPLVRQAATQWAGGVADRSLAMHLSWQRLQDDHQWVLRQDSFHLILAD